MKYIYIGLILLLVSIVGCMPDDDYCADYYTQGQIKGIEESKDKINSITTELETQKNEVVRLKEENLECKQNFLTNCSVISGDCTTCVRQKARCETQLEECYTNYSNDDCNDEIDELEDDLDDCEDDLDDYKDDLNDCEEDLNECETELEDC